MHEHTNERRDHRLAIGFLAGTAVGVGLMMWLAPKAASELRDRVSRKTRDLGQRASDRYDDVAGRVGSAVEDFARKGQAVRDDVADVVARGAHDVARGARGVVRGANEVEAFATSVKSDRA
jgi:gas vesicle protein